MSRHNATKLQSSDRDLTRTFARAGGDACHDLLRSGACVCVCLCELAFVLALTAVDVFHFHRLS